MRTVAALALAAAFSGCGYRVAGRADLLPKNIKTIAVPAFANTSSRHKLSDWLAAAVTREFISRTRYNIVADPNLADATLSGAVINYALFPTTFDPQTTRASAVQINVNLSITLRDRAGKVLFTRPNFEVHERYEIATDQRAYVDESDMALDRLSRAVARSVVSAILENF